MNFSLSDLGIAQCDLCGALTTDAGCASCYRMTTPPMLSCPGWACPLKGKCSRFLASEDAPRNTNWSEPPYDPLTERCEEYATL